MKRHMDCSGFVTTPKTEAFLSEVLNQIQHLCPQESYLDAHVKKEKEKYQTTIIVKYGDGVFSANSEGPSLKKSVSHTAQNIIRQIGFWHKNRFKN